ncbi:MAG: hypothetical protein L0170_08930 [Acidobacteria bacterium]|nr:hypothetical protein [Acidobacteriota bacterium]
MRTHFKFLAVLLLALSGFWPSDLFAAGFTRDSAGFGAVKPDLTLFRETLRASGVTDPVRRLNYEASFLDLLSGLEHEIGFTRSAYRRARKLHLAMHEKVLRRYVSTADGLDAVLDRGEFNCLSASLLYGMVARSFGLEVQVVEIPRHVYVRLFVDQRRVEVESTSRTGFDLRPKLDLLPVSPSDPGYGSNASATGEPPAMAASLPDGVDLERAVGFLWHNRGRRALEEGEAVKAARSFLEESRLEPPGASHSETLGMFLARGFRMAYEAGNFRDAYLIAEIGIQIFPGQTTARDRLLAASLKRIEATCESGRLSEAEEILNLTVSAVGNAVDVRRLERGACPLIAAAAVRAEDWDRASRMARRFAIAEPDRFESSRLSQWVARREHESLSGAGTNACIEPAAAFSPFLEVGVPEFLPDSRSGAAADPSPAPAERVSE